MQDNRTYGFSREDASELINMIGSAESITPVGMIRDNVPVLFRVHEDGIAGTTTIGEWESAESTILRTDGTEVGTKKLYNPSEQDIEGDAIVLGVNIGGKWFAVAPGGGPAMAFFRLAEDAGTTVLLQAIRGNYDTPGSGDPEEVVNWSGLLDNAAEGYLGLFAPVTHTEDNPDYQPDPEEPDYDPRATISRTIWASAQGACIPPPA